MGKKVTRKIDLGNPFDTIASSTPPAKKNNGAVRPVANLTEDLRQKVDTILKNKAEIARLKAELDQAEQEVIGYVRPQQDALAYDGSYVTSMDLHGIDNNLLYVTSDKFSVAQDEDTKTALKKLLGDKYDEAFTKTRTITLKEDMQQNQEFITNLVKALTNAGLTLADAFVVQDIVKPVKGLAEKQYKLVAKPQLEEWRSLCVQAKPALKSTSK